MESRLWLRLSAFDGRIAKYEVSSFASAERVLGIESCEFNGVWVEGALYENETVLVVAGDVRPLCASNCLIATVSTE